MAKVTTEHTTKVRKVVSVPAVVEHVLEQHQIDVIVCSTCGKKSGYSGKTLVQKWAGRDWFCKEHRPEGFFSVKPLCTCGHVKSSHDNGKYKCQGAHIWKDDHHHKYQGDCGCRKYVATK